MRSRIAVYCLDQDRATTSTLGVYHYTRNLVDSFARQSDPGFDIVLLLSEANASDMSPHCAPPWMSAVVIPGAFGVGLRRLWADHLGCTLAAGRARAQVVHFPKGWIAGFPANGMKTIATVHDTIHERLAEESAPYGSWFKRTYFRWQKQRTMRKADHIITVSLFSRDDLITLFPERKGNITVTVEGPGLPFPSTPLAKVGNQLLIIGSARPHKATAETLRMLARFKVGSGIPITAVVTGLSAWNRAWGPEPADMQIKYVGRITDQDMVRMMGQSQALVFLSEIEGFGLPLLEAYAAYTPACYRNSTALAEVMSGIPGGWDGKHFETFRTAMEEVLSLSPASIRAYRSLLLGKYNWNKAAQQTLDIYRSVLDDLMP